MLVSVRLAMVLEIPIPTFSPLSSSTGMTLIMPRKATDSCILVSRVCCTLGCTANECRALVMALSLASWAVYCSNF
ncbi:hypothetical protein D3C78_1314560 [compost metagenome]